MAEGRVVRSLGVSRGLGIGTFMVGMAVVLAACGSSSTPIDDDEADGGRARPGADDGGTGDGGIFGDPTPIRRRRRVRRRVPEVLPRPRELRGPRGPLGQHGRRVRSGDKTQKWNPTVAALKAFFNSPQSDGTNASLAFFPKPGNYDPTTVPQANPEAMFRRDLLGAHGPR
ncbi:MAG: hypothetical protein U0169_10160 [Polyangiaceae bacterium]